MRHDEFQIGATFWCGGRAWRCTDIGTRTIVAVCLDDVAVDINVAQLRRTLNQHDAEAEGWFSSEEMRERLQAWSAEPRPQPAVWRRVPR